MTNHKFDLTKYDTVKERKAKFYKDNPDGRIVVEQLNLPEQIKDLAEFKTYLYRNGSDQEKNLPWATGHALEIRDMELSTSTAGHKYESVNYTSWTENAEESSVGRALDNAGYAGTPSREEMAKVERHIEVLSKPTQPKTENQDELNFSDLGKTPEKDLELDEKITKKNTTIKKLYAVVGKTLREKGNDTPVRDYITTTLVKNGYPSLARAPIEFLEGLIVKFEKA